MHHVVEFSSASHGRPHRRRSPTKIARLSVFHYLRLETVVCARPCCSRSDSRRETVVVVQLLGVLLETPSVTETMMTHPPPCPHRHALMLDGEEPTSINPGHSPQPPPPEPAHHLRCPTARGDVQRG